MLNHWFKLHVHYTSAVTLDCCFLLRSRGVCALIARALAAQAVHTFLQACVAGRGCSFNQQTGSACRPSLQHGNKAVDCVCRDGKVIPWDLVKRGIEATHPYSVFMVRSMLAVPFFEKALYELPEGQVTPEQVTALADSIEKDVEGGLAGRSDTVQS